MLGCYGTALSSRCNLGNVDMMGATGLPWPGSVQLTQVASIASRIFLGMGTKKAGFPTLWLGS